jgi:hypothetical protein
MLLTDFCNRLTTRAPVDRSVFEREAFTVTDLRRALPRSHVAVDLGALHDAGATQPFGERSPDSMRA